MFDADENGFDSSDWVIDNGVLVGPQPGMGSYFSEVTIPSYITAIGDECFKSCKNLSYVEIPNSVKWIGKSAFWGLENLSSVTIPGSVETIHAVAFGGCKRLRHVTILDGVKTIEFNAFCDCPIWEIEIPASVTSLDPFFLSASNDVDISVDEGNKTYKVSDGNLYSYDGKALIRCFAIGSNCAVKIPQGVTEIGPRAFENRSNLRSVEIPDGVVSIGHDAFRECRNLSGIELPTSVASIGTFAFHFCYGLKSIVFKDPTNWARQEPYKGAKCIPVKDKILRDPVKARDFMASEKGKGGMNIMVKLTGDKA